MRDKPIKVCRHPDGGWALECKADAERMLRELSSTGGFDAVDTATGQQWRFSKREETVVDEAGHPLRTNE